MPKASSAPPAAFGLYVHWPFCLAKCPYCDFNSHVRSAIDVDSFAAMLLRELSHFAARTPGRALASIFFGGGTPSLMPPSAVAAIIDAATGHWATAPGLEITLEANPTSTEAENFRGYRNAGVNRVSLGVQALNDADLRFLGRQHSAAEALAAFRLARGMFARTSFDLIYARPGQTLNGWRRELGQALDEQNGHMSLYQLTIEPGTPFARWHASGKLPVPDDDLAADLFDLTQDLTAKAGLPAYEISNHASPGHECRHNLIYWGHGEYAGIGPGAHSRLAQGDVRLAVHTIDDPRNWSAQVAQQGHGIAAETRLTPFESAEEYVLMGLRHVAGIDPTRFARLAARPLDQQRIANLVAHGFLHDHPTGHVSATAKGRHVLNAITRELLA